MKSGHIPPLSPPCTPMVRRHSRSFRLSSSLCAGLALLMPALLTADESKLWGKNGELWKPEGRLDDFSYAGYHFGEAKPPSLPVDVSIKDFGAVGDGRTDDTAAFKRAVVEAAGKVILIPAGTYVLSDRIEYTGTGTVLRGESRDTTVLFFTKGLEQLYPSPTENDSGTPTTQWSWGGGLLSIKSKTITDGPFHLVVEGAGRGGKSLTVEKPGVLKPGELVVVSWHSNETQTGLTQMLYANDAGDASGVPEKNSRHQLNKIVSMEGTKLELLRPLRFPFTSGVRMEVHRMGPESKECGIEDLTLKFDSGIYRAHFQEQGFNGVAIALHAVNCWVRRLRIVDADNGIFGAGTNGLIEDIIFESKRKSLAEAQRKGHHGIDGGRDCLIQDVVFDTTYFHDLSVSSPQVGNVFRRVRGEDLNMDHHRWAPTYNLFTDIDLGKGERPWLSGGGRNRGKHSGIGTTFWNLRSNKSLDMPLPDFGPAPLQFIGLRVGGKDKTEDGAWWVETVNPAKLVPQDLYEAQLQKRLAAGIRMLPKDDTLAADGPSGGTAMDKNAVHEWKNSEGKALQAKFGGVQGNAVMLILPNGQSYTVPLEKLDENSRKQATTLASQP